MPWRPHLPECPKSTKNYNSQDPLPLPATHIAPSMQCPGKLQRPWLLCWELTSGTTAVTAPRPGVWRLRVTTVWLSLVLEDEFTFD